MTERRELAAGWSAPRGPYDEAAAFRLSDVGHARARGKRVEGELAADDARFLQQLLYRRTGRVDACRDDPVQCGRDVRPRSVLKKHPDVLLDEERVPLGPRHHVAHRNIGAVAHQLPREPLGLVFFERFERESKRIRPPGAPCGAPLEQVRSGQTHENERRPEMVEQVFDQGEQGILGPVQVLEHDRAQARAEPGFEVARERLRDLRAPLIGRDIARRRRVMGEHECRQGATHPARVGAVPHECSDLRLDLRLRGVTGVRRRDSRFSTDEHLERPIRDRLAVGKARDARPNRRRGAAQEFRGQA